MPSRKVSTQPQGPRRARLFRNGRNQALRIPRELEFPGDEVILHKEDDRLIVELVARRRSLAEIIPGLRPLIEDFRRPLPPCTTRKQVIGMPTARYRLDTNAVQIVRHCEYLSIQIQKLVRILAAFCSAIKRLSVPPLRLLVNSDLRQ